MQLATSLAWLRNAYVIEPADTPELVAESQRLRHEVFVRERRIFAQAPGQSLEADAFDRWSRHLLIRRRSDREAIGTARLVLFRPDEPVTLPIQRVCNPDLLTTVPLRTAGEISRFALSKTRRGGDAAQTDSLLILTLVEGILHLSLELGLTHWCAVMERSLLRLLRSIGINFEPLGPVVSYYGQRQPAVAKIASLIAEGRHRRPDYYEFLTKAAPSHDHRPSAQRIAA